MKTYTTRQGDTWDSVAFTQMGSCEYTNKLMWENQQLLDYYTFPAGVELAIPDVTPAMSSTAPPWKKVGA